MGSPVSPIVANLCMEEIEDFAHSQSTVPPKKWFRYVDDVFAIIIKKRVEQMGSIKDRPLLVKLHWRDRKSI